MEGLTHIDIILVQLAIVFLPGLIWAQIDARYAAKEKPGQAEFMIRAFLFGMSTYAIAYVGYRVFGRDFSDFGIDGPDSTRLLRGEFVDEIIASAVLSFVLAVVVDLCSELQVAKQASSSDEGNQQIRSRRCLGLHIRLIRGGSRIRACEGF